MNLTVSQINNCWTLDTFRLLQEQNRNPVCGVYRDRELVILSVRRDDVLGRIWEAVKWLAYSLLRCVGLIQIDPKRIRQLMGEADENIYNRTNAAWVGRLDEVKGECAYNVQAIGELKEQIQVETRKLAELRDELQQAQGLVAQMGALQKQNDDLQHEIDAGRTMLEQIPDLSNEWEALNTKIREGRATLERLENDISQLDFQTKVAGLEKQIQDLKAKLGFVYTKMALCQTCRKFRV